MTRMPPFSVQRLDVSRQAPSSAAAHPAVLIAGAPVVSIFSAVMSLPGTSGTSPAQVTSPVLTRQSASPAGHVGVLVSVQPAAFNSAQAFASAPPHSYVTVQSLPVQSRLVRMHDSSSAKLRHAESSSVSTAAVPVPFHCAFSAGNSIFFSHCHASSHTRHVVSPV